MYILKILFCIWIDILDILDILDTKWELEAQSTCFFACFVNVGRPNRAEIWLNYGEDKVITQTPVYKSANKAKPWMEALLTHGVLVLAKSN